MIYLAIIFILLGAGMFFFPLQNFSNPVRVQNFEFLSVWRYQLQELNIDLGQNNLIFGLLISILFIVLFFVLGPIGGILGIGVVVAGPTILQNWLKKQQLRQFERQLPDVLEMLAANLKVGQSFAQSMQPIQKTFPEPIASAFADIHQDIQLGTSIVQALNRQKERYDLREWHLFINIMEILLELGGNLAKMVEVLANTMRRRQHVQEKLMTLTAQGRFQGIVMGIIPIGMFFILRKMDPVTFGFLTQNLLGWAIIFVASGFEFIAIFLMRKILSVEI